MSPFRENYGLHPTTITNQSTRYQSIEDSIAAQRPYIYNRLRARYRLSHFDADDITQDVLEKALMNKSQLQSDGEICAYMNVIIKNILLDMNKRSKIFITETAYKSFIEVEGNEEADEFVDPFDKEDPAGNFLTRHYEIEQVLQHISKTDLQEMIRLRMYGFTSKEIGERLNANPATVRVYSNKLIPTLKRMLVEF
jgi:RNA polymerase sigma factor (sigma-70 family)